MKALSNIPAVCLFGSIAVGDAYAAIAGRSPSGHPKAHALGREVRLDNAIRGPASVPVSLDQDDVLVLVEIGTPPQQLQLSVDTASSALWVIEERISSNFGGHNAYDPSKSSTSSKTSSNFEGTDEDGNSVDGPVYSDIVAIGGFTADSQLFSPAVKVPDGFKDRNADGVLGLGLPGPPEISNSPWFFTANDQGNFDENLFVVDLRSDAGGSLSFGAIPSDIVNINYANLMASDVEEGLWQFNVPSSYGSFQAILDTATTPLYLPVSIVKEYYDKVPGAKAPEGAEEYHTFPCGTLPDFPFGVGDGAITIPGKLLELGETEAGSGRCVGAIMYQKAGQESTVGTFGRPVFHAAYVVFDIGNRRIGLAQKSDAK